jgi:hypothetical protein
MSAAVAEGEELDFADVGEFKDSSPSPGSSGLFRYEPYRSGHHYDLQQRLRRGEQVPCRLVAADGAVLRFVVCGCPDHGVLEINCAGP